ncbi:hypothetical protein [Streptomyces sp. S1D4-14]|uniref:hypothetical protein n=1 Tax=Streptomyces sp. S1D4-14 TaxID=2594461 RepID=UPI00215A4251|nr:hypothetical protein [Streptomyces sp. S1D4-14]
MRGVELLEQRLDGSPSGAGRDEGQRPFHRRPQGQGAARCAEPQDIALPGPPDQGGGQHPVLDAADVQVDGVVGAGRVAE